jgi:4-diphosphocytidyl-2C-methyl-D-erythritol kinase
VTSLETRAGAKVNLVLRVLGRRDDGYHELFTIFDELELHDTLRWEPGEGEPRLFVELEGASQRGLEVPATGDNLVLRAASGFARVTGKPVTGSFRLTKRIPAGGGLGGGSSDAAAALRLMAEHHGIGAAEAVELLADEAAALGADVPFFLTGGRAWADNRGDRIHPLMRGPSLFYVLVHPGFAIATRDVFARWHRALQDTFATLSSSSGASGPTDSAGHDLAARQAASFFDTLESIASGPRPVQGALTQGLFNDLTQAAFDASPELMAVWKRAAGITRLHLSGSGSTLFAVTLEADQARELAARLEAVLENHATVLVTRSRL